MDISDSKSDVISSSSSSSSATTTTTAIAIAIAILASTTAITEGGSGYCSQSLHDSVDQGENMDDSDEMHPSREQKRRQKQQQAKAEAELGFDRSIIRSQQGRSSSKSHRSSRSSYSNYPFALLVLLVIVSSCLITSTDAFSTRAFQPRTSLAVLQMVNTQKEKKNNKQNKPTNKSSSPDSSVHLVQPRTSTSARQREEAIKALAKQEHLEANARTLELLSSQYLYPGAQNQPRSPRIASGRPAMVPGAMKRETIERHREDMQLLREGKITWGDIQARKEFQRNGKESDDNNDQMWAAAAAATTKPATDSAPPKRKRGRPKKETKPGSADQAAASTNTKTQISSLSKGVKGASQQSPRAAPNDRTDLEREAYQAPKRRKVAKNLPPSRRREDGANQVWAENDESEVESLTGRRITKFRRPSDSQDLQRYYRTELLTAKEEYSLGMKVHFMVQCERVHEGLALRLERLPTFQEWAFACGFKEEDAEFFEREAYKELRPSGSEEMFVEKDPNMFVGNGLASELGVGRGRGRVKKLPPGELGEFYDDSYNRFRPNGEPAQPKIAVNQGTPTHFVDLLMEGRRAKQRMVSSNMRLVVSIAKKYARAGVNVQDLVQEGSLGLSRAAERFEPQKGFKFSTYASWWIQQAVFLSIAYHSRTIRLPVHVHNLLNKIRKVRRNVEREIGRTPTNEEMAKALEMPVDKYERMIRLSRKAISLESPKYSQNPKDYGLEGVDMLKDTIDGQTVDQNDDPEKDVDRTLFHKDLAKILDLLEDDERRVICARYGLEDGLTRSVTTVAAQMKQPKAWVRSKESRALRKLRRPWYEQRLKEHQESLSG